MTKKDPSRELAIAASDLAADGKALDISILELRDISSVADYFVVASGRSHIQVESICDRIVEGVRERLGERPIAVEGLENSQWAVLDYGSVVIHVFQEGVRKLYDLERLWSLAPSWRHGEEPPAAVVADGSPAPQKKAARSAASRNGTRTAGRTAGKATGSAAGKPASKTARKTAAKAAGKPAGKGAGNADGKTAARKAPKADVKAGTKPAARSGAKTGAKVAAKSAAKKPASKAAKQPAAKKTTTARSRATAASGSSEVAGTSGPSNVAGLTSPPRRIARA
jgi:ribosome-associated protein